MAAVRAFSQWVAADGHSAGQRVRGVWLQNKLRLQPIQL